MTTFFISDNHFGHENIIKLMNRDFKSIEEMDEFMIEKWNSVVRKDDVVYHLGDFSYRSKDPKQYFDRLNGKKHLIKGNHDSEKVLQLPWESVKMYDRLHIGEKIFILFHYPIHEWDQFYRGSYHLYGHVHGSNPVPQARALDMGVENPWVRYIPVAFEELEAIFDGRENNPKIVGQKRQLNFPENYRGSNDSSKSS